MSQFFGTSPVLPVPDVGAAVAYYCDTLGFTLDALTDDPPTHGSVTRDRVGIQFTQVAGAVPPYAGWTYIFVTDWAVSRRVALHRANDDIRGEECMSDISSSPKVGAAWARRERCRQRTRGVVR